MIHQGFNMGADNSIQNQQVKNLASNDVPSKATIKKKALLNFRAIKNNFVVKNNNEDFQDKSNQLIQTYNDLQAISQGKSKLQGFDSATSMQRQPVQSNRQPPGIPHQIDFTNFPRTNAYVAPNTANNNPRILATGGSLQRKGAIENNSQ